mgnify:CR=1 FL=1
MKLTSVRDVADIMNRHGLKFNKGYGQNFLINEAVPKRIAAECGADPDSGILEIGPGIGTLTRELCARYRKVVAVEIDSSLIPALKETTADLDNLVIINDDIMKTDLDRLISDEFAGMNVTVCANLPYYITTPIIMKLLEEYGKFAFITVMVQKEVAQRLCSKPSDDNYGAITAQINLYASVKRLFSVPSGCFFPRPKVDSAVIRIEPYKVPRFTKEQTNGASKLIKASFSQRRKTLVNSLSGIFADMTKTELGDIVSETLGMGADVRGEKLEAGDFVKLYEALKDRM